MDYRQQSALEIASFLSRRGIPLVGKKILDIGTRTGENAKIMSDSGAEVVVVEPDKESLSRAIELRNVDPERSFPVLLQELPSQYQGSFDIATVFLFNVPWLERAAFAEALLKAVKPGGKIIVSVADPAYKDGGSADVGKYLRQYFGAVDRITQGSNCFFVAEKTLVSTKGTHTTEPIIIDKGSPLDEPKLSK
jgi:SAM-dependent methyltransferase